MATIDTKIKPELWGAIANSYTSENYTNAIKDAMSYLTEILRDKSGEDGDGYQLVGKALGGNPPKIQVNKLQTETERNIQKGIEETLRGIYRFIRNPRSHEQINDSKEDADSIILFVNYLLSFLGESTYYFTIENFVHMITDDFFVEEFEYVEGLVEKIPVRKRLDTLIEIYRNRTWRYSDNFSLMIPALLELLNEDEIQQFMQVISDEFQSIHDEAEVSLLIKVLPIDYWGRIEKLTRMRLENMMIETIKQSWLDSRNQRSNKALSSWAATIAPQFTLRAKLKNAVHEQLQSLDFDRQNLIAKYFLKSLPAIYSGHNAHMKVCVNQLVSILKQGNEFMKNELVTVIPNYPQDWKTEIEKKIIEEFDSSTGFITNSVGKIEVDGFEAKPNPAEDDIPF